MTKYTSHSTGAKTASSARATSPQTASAVARVRDVVFKFRKQVENFEAELDKRQTLIPRQYVFGLREVVPDEIFRETDSQGRVHIVLALAAHLLDGVMHYKIDGKVIDPTAAMSADGTVTLSSAPFRNKLRLRFSPGFTPQNPDPLLISETSLTDKFQGNGIAYVYARLIPDPVFNNNDSPEIRVILRGARCSDPRGTFGWTINPVAQLWHLLIEPKRRGCAGIDFANVDGDGFRAAAAFAEEKVSAPNFTRTSPRFGIEFANIFIFQEAVNPFQYGDIVRVVPIAGQTVPSALSTNTDYHVIILQDRADLSSLPHIALATTFANAMKGTRITFGIKPTALNIRKVGEVRFSASWTRRGDQRLSDAIEDLLRSMDARLTWYDNRIRLVLPQFTTPKTISLGTHITGDIAFDKNVPRSERCTSLVGGFTSPQNLYRTKDTPAAGGAAFEAIDRGQFDRRHDILAVDRTSQAQRIMLFEFRRRRQEKTISFSTHLSAWKLRAGDIFSLDDDVVGLDAGTTFQVTFRQLFMTIDGDRPVFGLDFQARQLEATTFDVAASDQAFIAAIALPNQANPRETIAPGAPNISEQLVQTVQGGGLKVKLLVNWAASPDPFLSFYRFRYRLQGATAFTTLDTPDTELTILDFPPGSYDFELSAFNTLGVQSTLRTTQGTVQGTAAKPSPPTGFRLQPTGSTILLTWAEAPELDVRIGGQFQVWHHHDEAGGQSANALLLALVNGDLQVKTVPFVRGTFYLRKKDQAGKFSDFVDASTLGRSAVDRAQFLRPDGIFDPTDLAADEASFQADPGWPDDHPDNTVAFDDGVILLPTVGTLDTLGPNWDDIEPTFDTGGEVAPEAVYYFPTGIEFPDVIRFRVETQVAGAPIELFGTWDQRIGNVDGFFSWDFITPPGTADAWMEARVSKGPLDEEDGFGDWKRVYVEDFRHRSIEFRVRIRTNDPSVNYAVSRARVFLREIIEPGRVVPQPDDVIIPVSISGIPTPRVGYTTPKEAAFSASVVRAGFTIAETAAAGGKVPQVVLNRVAAECSSTVIGNGFKTGVYDSTNPWSGSGSSTIFTADFSFTNARIAELKSTGLFHSHFHNFFWPLFPACYDTATPAANAAELLDRMRAHIKTVVDAYGPKQLQGKGDFISNSYVDLCNEVVDSSSTGQTTDLIHNGGQWRTLLGNDWAIDAIELARPLFPTTTKLGWNEFGIEHGFSPVPVPDATTGVSYSGDTGPKLFGYTNSSNEVMARQRLARLVYDAIDAGFPPDFIGLQTDINGAQGSDPVDQATYLDLPSMFDWCAEMTNLGIELHITEGRLNYGTGSEDTLIQADADQLTDFIDIVMNNSVGTIVNAWSEFLLGPYISLYDQVGGLPSTARGANNVDFFNPWLDGIAKIKPLAVRRASIPKVASRLLIHQVAAVQRPIIWSGTPGSGSFDARGGWLPTFQDVDAYADLEDFAQALIDFDRFTFVTDIWIQPAAASATEVWFHFSQGADGDDAIQIQRNASEILQIDVLVTNVSTIGGPTTISAEVAQAGAGSDFPEGNTAGAIDEAEALNRSTRLAMSVDLITPSITLSFNGNTAVTVSPSAVPPINRMYIGGAPGVTTDANRCASRIRRIKFYDGLKTSAELVTLSGGVWGDMS